MGASREKTQGQVPGERGHCGQQGGGLSAGPHEEDTPNPNRSLWQLTAALLMETEHSPKGADRQLVGGRGGLWVFGVGGWISSSQFPVGQPLSRVRGEGF